MTASSISDVEIVAELFRIARSGRAHTAQELLDEGILAFSNESPERVLQCVHQLGNHLANIDYQGFSTQYRRTRRPKAKGLRLPGDQPLSEGNDPN